MNRAERRKIKRKKMISPELFNLLSEEAKLRIIKKIKPDFKLEDKNEDKQV